MYLLKSYRDHCVGHIWNHQERQEVKHVSHDAQVLPYATHLQVQALLGPVDVRSPCYGVVSCHKQRLGERLFGEVTPGDVFLPPICRRDDYHFG